MAQTLCILCGAPSDLKFELPLVSGLTGNYYECRRCQFLRSDHLDDPAVLQSVYTNTLGAADVGAAWRARCVADRILQLAAFRLFPGGQQCRFLDFGCGPGYVANLLAFRKGWDVYGFEPFMLPQYLPSRNLASRDQLLAHAPFNLIVASEVLEHFVDPASELRQISEIMADTGFLYVTTGLYRTPGCDKNWSYLAPQSGQHVSFYSKSAIKEAMRLIGASSVYQVGAEYEWFFVRNRARQWQAGITCKVLTSLVRLGLIARIE
jgi:2-polyprenyl-3-methyl-5-hydroxy-6-metoxy-1,4-benzoquinol methylase